MGTNSTNATVQIESTVHCPTVDCSNAVVFSATQEVDLETQTLFELGAYKKALTDKLYESKFHQLQGFVGGDWYCPQHPSYPGDGEENY